MEAVTAADTGQNSLIKLEGFLAVAACRKLDASSSVRHHVPGAFQLGFRVGYSSVVSLAFRKQHDVEQLVMKVDGS